MWQWQLSNGTLFWTENLLGLIRTSQIWFLTCLVEFQKKVHDEIEEEHDNWYECTRVVVPLERRSVQSQRIRANDCTESDSLFLSLDILKLLCRIGISFNESISQKTRCIKNGECQLNHDVLDRRLLIVAIGGRILDGDESIDSHREDHWTTARQSDDRNGENEETIRLGQFHWKRIQTAGRTLCAHIQRKVGRRMETVRLCGKHQWGTWLKWGSDTEIGVFWKDV